MNFLIAITFILLVIIIILLIVSLSTLGEALATGDNENLIKEASNAIYTSVVLLFLVVIFVTVICHNITP